MNEVVQEKDATTIPGAKPEGELETRTTQPEQAGTEGTEQQREGEEQKEPETPEKRESRSRRRFNRERDRRIAAETELRLLKEAQQPPKAEAKAAEKTEIDPNEPKREQFGPYEEFIEARATYRAERAARSTAERILKEASERQGKDQQRESQAKASREWETQLESARDEIEDFDDVLKESEARYSPAMEHAIRESEVGARLTYYLAQHPEESERILKLKPSRQMAEVVKLEEKVSKPAKAPSKAPAPISPVGGKDYAAANVPTTDPRSDKMSTEAWIAAEKARMKKEGIRA